MKELEIAHEVQKKFLPAETPEYQHAEIEAICQLGEGDLYLFFTDGISEANNSSGEEFGEERLEKLIVRFAESGPKTILDEIRNSVMRFSGKTRRRDDITAIAVKIKDTFNKSG